VILEHLVTRRGDEVFLRMTEQDAIHLISILSSMLLKQKPANGSTRILQDDNLLPLNLSIHSQEQYDKMLGG
jgi:hypothetical protein